MSDSVHRMSGREASRQSTKKGREAFLNCAGNCAVSTVCSQGKNAALL